MWAPDFCNMLLVKVCSSYLPASVLFMRTRSQAFDYFKLRLDFVILFEGLEGNFRPKVG